MEPRYDAKPLQQAYARQKMLGRLNYAMLAQRAGVSIATAHRVVAGKDRSPRSLPDICAVLGVDIEDCLPAEVSA